MTTCPQVSGTEQVIARMSLNSVTVRVVLETPSDFPYAIYLSKPGSKSARIDAFCQLEDALRTATNIFLHETTRFPS